MKDFYLVQRLTRRDLPGRKGFDGIFGCQYMGSAEFEWGAIPESLKRIRGSRKIVIHEGRVTRGSTSHAVFVVGDRKVVPTIPDRLTEWVKDARPRGKEWTYFEKHLDGTAEDWHDVDAWWALNEDVLWTLSPEIADDLLRAVQP